MLNKILSLPNGAHFYRVDLHNHTPADPGFHCGKYNLNNPEECRELAREYVRFAHEVQKIDILGITDHNDTSWIQQIQEAAAELYPDSLIIFPGVEVGANEGKRQVHFLALFNPHTNPAHIDHFISSLGLLPHARFHEGSSPTPRLTQLNTRQLTQRIVSREDGMPGLAIAAHAIRKNGLFHELEGESRVLAYEDPNLVAVEIPNTRADLSDFVQRLVNGEEEHYGFKAVACINSSDGRGLTKKLNGRLPVGEKATRIKLSTFNVEALRHALIDFDSRIRLEGSHVEEKYPRLLGLAVEGGFLSGDGKLNHKEPFLIHFNQNLNTIIGGRGTGKSSLIEAIRYVFDLSPRTEATAAQHTNITAATLPKGACITAFYELANGSRYKIVRRADQNPAVFDIDSGQKIDIHPKNLLPGDVPLEVYGQKEVYEIANDVSFQLNLIDTFLIDSLHEVERRENELLRWLESNSQQIMRLEDEVQEADQQLAQLPAVALELERLENDTILQKLQDKKALEHERHELQRFEQTIRQREQTLAELRATLTTIDTEPASEFLATQTNLVNGVHTLIDQTLETLIHQIKSTWQEGLAEREQWQKRYAENEEAFQELLQTHGDALSIERYFALQTKKQTLEQLALQKSKQEKRLEKLQAERQEKLQTLHQLRFEEAFEMRRQKAAELTAALQGNVRITITAAGNKEALAEFLKQLFERRGISKNVFQLLAESDMRPLELARAIREEQQATADDVTTLAQIGVTAAYRRKLATLPDKLIYELETYRLPDLPDIALKVGEEYRSLTPPLGVPGLSMGQKCTAILSIILVERNTPLVIDQPEDDLDNAFIFREIVQTLRREKERRQFIIATHNANIPVSGDAELIILMNANEEHGWAAYRGSIDDHAIRGPVETILEGGREAFLLRQAKYSMVNY